MRALVTGGAGFIGSHLCDALVSQGARVTVFDDLSNGTLANLGGSLAQVEFVQASITDSKAIHAAARDCDVVFHLAAVSNVAQTIDDPPLGHAVNATGTLNVFEAAKSARARVVYSSSAAVYGDGVSVPTSEVEPTRPISPYGSQKLLGELYLRNYCELFGLTGTALRYFNVYGPRQRADSPYSGVISVFADRAMSGSDIVVHGGGRQTRDFVSVHDVVRANLLAAGRTSGSCVANVCTGIKTSVLSLAETMTALSGSASKVVVGPARSGDILDSCGDPGVASAELGFTSLTRIEDGLGELLESLARND